MKKKRLQRSDRLWLCAVALLILLQFWWLPGTPGTPNDTYSNSIAGKRGFFQTLKGLSEANMLPPVLRETERLVPDKPCTLVIVGPDRYPDANEQMALSGFVRNGGTLLFAPNWMDGDCKIRPLNISTEYKYFASEDTVTTGVSQTTPNSTSPNPATQGTENLPAEADETVDVSPLPSNSSNSAPAEDAELAPKEEIENAIRASPSLGPPVNEIADSQKNPNDFSDVADMQTRSQLVEGTVTWRTRASMNANSRADALVVSGSGTVQAAAWAHGSGKVLLSASPDVFSNAAMLDPARAELAIRLVEYVHTYHTTAGRPGNVSAPIVVSEFLNVSDKYHGTAVLMSPGLRSGSLQLLLVALMAGWFGFHRFGPVKQKQVSQRRSLTESASALGNLHFRTNSGSEAVQSYLEYMKTQISRTFGTSVRLDDTSAIAVRSDLDHDDVEHAIMNATELAENPITSNQAAGTAIRQLSEILERLGGTRKEQHEQS